MTCPLHPRAIEAIHWLSIGKTHDETAAMMNITRMTVHRILVRAKDKAGCSTTVSLVSSAIRNGWVQ